MFDNKGIAGTFRRKEEMKKEVRVREAEEKGGGKKGQCGRSISKDLMVAVLPNGEHATTFPSKRWNLFPFLLNLD